MSAIPARTDKPLEPSRDKPREPSRDEALLLKELTEIRAGWAAMTPTAKECLQTVIQSILLEPTDTPMITGPARALLLELAALSNPTQQEQATSAAAEIKPRRQPRRVWLLRPLPR